MSTPRTLYPQGLFKNFQYSIPTLMFHIFPVWIQYMYEFFVLQVMLTVELLLIVCLMIGVKYSISTETAATCLILLKRFL